MDRIFVDTLFVIALVSNRDQRHQQAVTLSHQYTGWPFLTTDAVLLEIGNGLARSHKQEAGEIIERFLASAQVEVVHLTPDLFRRGFNLYKSHKDKTWGLVDCISFIVMREAGVHKALTFDRHFEQAGFEILMQADSASG